MAIKVSECLFKTVKSDEEDLTIGVDLRESRAGQDCSWQFSATFPGCEKQNSRSFKSFFNTIGLFSKQDWDEWILVSQMLGLTFSPAGHMDDLEVAMSTDVDGEVQVTCIGTSTGEPPLLESHDIFEEVGLEEGAVEDGAAEEGAAEEGAAGEDAAEEGAVQGGAIQGGAVEEGAVVEGDVHGNIPGDIEASNSFDMDEPTPEENPDEDGTDDAQQLETKKSPAMFSCPLCDEIGYKDAWFLRRHIQRMHQVPIRCEICSAVFIDKYCYMKLLPLPSGGVFLL